jgi:hypothetical protein
MHQVVAGSTIGAEDMVFHSLFIGATGAGKTNALLYWLERLSRIPFGSESLRHPSHNTLRNHPIMPQQPPQSPKS